MTWSVLDHARVPKVGYAALRNSCRSVLPMLEPRRGLVHVANETRTAYAGAVVEVEIDGRRRSFTGDLAAADVTFVGPIHLDHRTGEVALTLSHPALGTVEHRYDDVLDWLRIVNDR